MRSTVVPGPVALVLDAGPLLAALDADDAHHPSLPLGLRPMSHWGASPYARAGRGA